MAKERLTVYLSPEVARALRVAAARRGKKDSEVVEEALRDKLLFTALDRIAATATMDEDEALQTKIKQRIRNNCTPRHVPAKIVQVKDIPRTKSGKITELAVRDVVHGRPIKNKEALANPEALDLYKDLPDLRT